MLVEQNLSLALGVADRVYVMSKGQIVVASLFGGVIWEG